jgi:hypothetical protein
MDKARKVPIEDLLWADDAPVIRARVFATGDPRT